MESCLILLQIVLNLDQRVEHLLINSVNQYSLGTVFLPNQWKQGNGEGRGVGLKISFLLGGRGVVSELDDCLKRIYCRLQFTMLFFLYS